MKLDEIKNQWTASAEQIGNGLMINLRLMAGLQKATSTLQGLSRSVIAEMIVGLVSVALLGGFLYDHYQEMAFFLPALVLHLFTICQIAFSGYQLVKLKAIDFSAPILESQKKLATLRRLRIDLTKWTLILSPLLWVPLLIVLLKGVLGINAYKVLDTTWLLANLLFGLAFIPIMLWVSKYLASRWQGSNFIKYLLDTLAGHELREINTFMDRLEKFEHADNEA